MPFDESRDLDRAVDAIRRSLELAGRASLKYFRSNVAVERKPDRSPVTAADRDAEAAILGELLAAFPGASVLAEESGERAGDPELRLIVDPLDGTRGFTRGGAFWGALVALEYRGEIVAGGAALPALGESYVAARGRGCFDTSGSPVRVSTVADWSDATLSLGEMRSLRASPQRDGIEALTNGAASVRCYGDVAGAVMALTGRAEAWLEAGVKPWDVAPMKILFEEAGGRFTDLAGDRTISTGSAVATNAALHDFVIETLRSRPEIR
jgi:histidinol-phosphatase